MQDVKSIRSSEVEFDIQLKSTFSILYKALHFSHRYFPLIQKLLWFWYQCYEGLDKLLWVRYRYVFLYCYYAKYNIYLTFGLVFSRRRSSNSVNKNKNVTCPQKSEIFDNFDLSWQKCKNPSKSNFIWWNCLWVPNKLTWSQIPAG